MPGTRFQQAARLGQMELRESSCRYTPIIGVHLGDAATMTGPRGVSAVLESHLVVAVIAVVACNVCNARIAHIARNAAGPRCVQRRNDVANCHWSVICGDSSVVLGPWLSLHARMQ